VHIDWFLWDECNTEHIARHGIHPGEVDEVLEGDYRTLTTHSGRYLLLGRTGAGRIQRIVMKKLKPLPKKIPHFSTYEEEAHFWDTHDISSLMEKKNFAPIQFAKPPKHLISIRMDHSLLQGLRTMAARRHIPYQTLIHTLLAEKLHEWHKKSA